MPPIYKIGNMWDKLSECDLFCITTNGTLRGDGKLVMGRGIAFQSIKHFPSIQSVAGHHIRQFNETHKTAPIPYGLLILKEFEPSIGLFQVKYNWWEPAQCKLIEWSTSKLRQLALDHPTKKIMLNFPGIGNGKLTQAEVRPIIDGLPSNVEVWKLYE